MTTKPHVHKRSSSGEAMCGRGGAHPQLTAYTDEVTCTYCALGVTGVSGHSAYPLPVRAPRWTALRDEITRDAAIEQQLGDDYSESSGDLSWDSANKHWGKAEALREVLATMDRMEAGQ